MRKTITKLTLATALATLPVAALAEDRALIIANSDYASAPDASMTGLVNAETGLREAGFLTVSLTDSDPAALRRTLSDFMADDPHGGRRVMLIGGHFVHSLSDSWLMGPAAETPDLVSADLNGIAMDVLMDAMAQQPGRAVILLAESGAEMPVGTGLRAGLGALDIPQGVAVLRGAPDLLAQLAGSELILPGASLADMAVRHSDAVSAQGFLPQGWAFGAVARAPAASPAPVAPPPAPVPPKPDTSADDAAWAQAKATDSKAGYQAYLDRWPQGVHAAGANAALESIRAADPRAQAEATEQALALSTDARKRLQRQLTLLDYDTRGIDGIFGSGTRKAVSGWQEANGHQPTGFLTARQIEAIASQAAERQAELEAEARARQEARDQADNALWSTLGDKAAEDQLRQYLKEYPDGLHAKEAQARLNKITAARDAAAAESEKAAWDKAETQATVAGYNAYLDAFPQGAHAETARARLDQIAKADAVDQAAVQQENALGLNDAARKIIESRLASLDLNPGKVDGVFDADSRSALRRYQESRGLPATGYMNEPTAVRLLADTLLQ